MGRFKLIVSLALLVALTAVGYGVAANAHSFKSGENVTVSSNQKINHTLFTAGNSVDIASEVFGDVFCAGQTVTVSGTVHGDVICAGQTVNITGDVDGDVRLAGQSVTVGGNVKGNATISGQTFTLGSNAKVGGDVTLGSVDGVFNGAVGRDIAVASDNTVIASSVGRNVQGEVESLVLTDSARVKGNVDYVSNRGVNKSSGAEVGGKITRSDLPINRQNQSDEVAAMAAGWFVYWFLAMILTAMVLALLLPRMLHSVTNQAVPQPWKALLAGFLASVLMPIVLVVLALSFIGMPLALLLGLAWFVVVLLSGPVFAYYVGRLVIRGSRKPLLIMLVGSIVLLVLYALPVLGFITLLAALWIGTGMILLEVFSRTPRPTYDLALASRSGPAKKK